MKINELIEQLKLIECEHGNIKCLIEVVIDDCVCLMPVGECSIEVREGYGKSLSLLC